MVIAETQNIGLSVIVNACLLAHLIDGLWRFDGKKYIRLTKWYNLKLQRSRNMPFGNRDDFDKNFRLESRCVQSVLLLEYC